MAHLMQTRKQLCNVFVLSRFGPGTEYTRILLKLTFNPTSTYGIDGNLGNVLAVLY